MIELTRVSKHYGTGLNRIKAVDDVSLKIGPGEFVMLTGHSGSGKTTLLNLMAGMTRPDTGTIIMAGRDIFGLRDAELSHVRASTIGFIFQFQSMLPTLNALDNVLLPAVFSRQPQDRTRALELLERVGLGGRASAYAHELSLGQQRRVSVARALVQKPPLILCDEPTGDLDTETELIIMDLIASAHGQGATVVMATHNQDLGRYASTAIMLDQGHLYMQERSRTA